MGRDCQHVFVLNIRPWPRTQRISVWPEIFWTDNRAFGRVKKKLGDSPVERAGEVSSVILWGFDERVEIAPRDEEG